jgi:hypothetical protein
MKSKGIFVNDNRFHIKVIRNSYLSYRPISIKSWKWEIWRWSWHSWYLLIKAFILLKCRIEHIKLIDDFQIEFDFLGKDSMRYFNTVKLDEIVYKNI